MQRFLSIISLLAIAAFIALPHALLAHGLEAQAQAPTSTIELGTFPPDSPPVSAKTMIANDTAEPFDILGVTTSCGCTTAKIKTGTLKPEETREIIVTFDPSTHPELRGDFKRVVYVATDREDLPEIEIEVHGTIDGPLTGSTSSPQASSGRSSIVVVYYNEACSDCAEWIRTTYPHIFDDYGYTLELHDYVDDKSARSQMREIHDHLGIPLELQSHIELYVGEKLVLGGHIPEEHLRWLLENPDRYGRLLIRQDEMHGDAPDYTLYDFEHPAITVPIETPLSHALPELSSGGLAKVSQKGFLGLAGLVTTSAFLDGLNPCAFAVLLFFIAFLFSIKRTRLGVWKMGLAYIFAVFLAYLLIGVGIAQAIVISGAPHLMAIVGSWLVIGLGVIQLVGLVFPRFPIHLRIPIDTKATLEKWMFKATLPAALIGGFLVGLCTFPCSGGIYVAIIGMLSAQRTYLSGLGWMIWYNLIFVLPLIILLALAGNPKSAEKLAALERIEAKKTKAVIGLFMILLGAIILIFFT